MKRNNRFSYGKNIRKSITAGLISVLPCLLLSVPTNITVVVGLIGLFSGSTFDIFRYINKIKEIENKACLEPDPDSDKVE
jgi:hypothetical protein